MKREQLKKAQRLVVKVGTSTVMLPNGRPNLRQMEELARVLASLKNEGRDVILVTSAAIAFGMTELRLSERPRDIPTRQALAAIGQNSLMHTYKRLFADYGQTVAQVLLTKENVARHHQYSHARDALVTLLELDVIPIINENDVVAIDEVKIGDNDTLSAIVATLVDADALLILSDIDGVYTANPSTDATATLIEEIAEITPEIEKLAGGAGSSFGTGGMATKIEAAKIATNAGTTLVIAKGSEQDVVRRVFAGERIGTIFPAKESHLRLRQNWLAFGKRIGGTVVVDHGCASALRRRESSLLAVGIVSVEGEFRAKTTLRVLTEEGQEIARGISNYSSSDIRKVMGRKSSELHCILGEAVGDEIIHRDNLVKMM